MTEAEAALIARAELFQGLSDRAFKAVVQASKPRHVTSGAHLLDQGEPSDHLFMVGGGRIKMIALAQDGTQQTLRFMEPGDIIGCAAVFRRIPYPATAVAMVDCTVLGWSTRILDDLMRSEPRLVQNALAIVGGRAYDMLQRLREATTASVEQRIARALVRLTEQQPTALADGVAEIGISRQELAELTDSSLYTVSRMIAAWTRAGILQRGRRRIIVKQLGKLTSIARV